MRFSASRLKLWMGCPLAAHYRYDEGLPSRPNGKTVFGTVMHGALELYNTTGDYDAMVAKFKADWLRPPVEPEWWPRSTSYAKLRAKGLEILESVKDHYRFQDRVVLGAEVRFLVPFGDHELTGIVDLVETRKSGTGRELLTVVDYKTQAKAPTTAELVLDTQMTAYLWAVSQREFWTGVKGDPEFPGLENGEWLWETVGRDMPKRAVWFGLWNGKELDAGPRKDEDFGRLYRVCEQIERAVAADVYVQKIGSNCEICDYVEPCSMEIPVALRGLNDPDDEERWV
jgi:RecB family exonuclease